jgi:hypothetical protein
MKAKKDIKSFLREEDWKAIKKSLLVSSLWLVLWFGLANSADAWHSNYNNHSSATWSSCHTSTHSSHNNHSSY